MKEGTSREEILKSIKKTRENVENEINNIISKLLETITNYDIVELLPKISIISQFLPEETSDYIRDLREKPILQFLTGFCLKHNSFGQEMPTLGDVKNVMDSLNEYFKLLYQKLIFEDTRKEESDWSDFIIFSAKNQKILEQVNPGKYPFQNEDLIMGIFLGLDDFYFTNYGFTISDAYLFGNKIIERYERLVKERYEKSFKDKEKIIKIQRDSVKKRKLVEYLEKEKIDIEEYSKNLFFWTLFEEAKDILIFKIDKFCGEENIEDVEKFRMYLRTFSCRFGDGNSEYLSPFDENLIVTKPIIKIDDLLYISPIPRYLICNLPIIFDNLLEEEKRKQSRIWQRYEIIKSKYLEKKTLDCFTSIFPQDRVFKKLFFEYDGKKFEVDLLVSYDNKIFIGESKSGLLTEPAKRGGIKRLKKDLRKLIEDAFLQGKNTMEYIKSKNDASFFNEKGDELLNIHYDPDLTKFFLINVTLEPLMGFSFSLRTLQSLGLFADNEYPWSVSIYELEIISKLIEYPSVFIHYLEKRMVAIEDNLFRAFDEISIFSYYLERGNLNPPLTEEGEKPFDFVSLDPEFIRPFDEHYLNGGKAPELFIEPEFHKIVRDLERLKPENYTIIISAFLDLEHNNREYIIKNINEIIRRTKEDHGFHDFTVVFQRKFDIGFTFITSVGRYGLRDRLIEYCEIKKYQIKSRRWIGIGIDIFDKEYFANEILYFNFPWERDIELDKILKGLHLKGIDEHKLE